MQRRRIAIAGFSQESNSFTGLSTTLDDFRVGGGEFLLGNNLLPHHTGVNTVLSGFVAALSQAGHEVVPLVAARASPGGPLTRDCFDTIAQELYARLRRESVDGVLISLHGAMLAEHESDPDGAILDTLREIVGAVPIVAVLDLHANVSPRMVEATSGLIAYREYPHTDLAVSGRRAAEFLQILLDGSAAPGRSFRPVSSLLPSINMRTTDPTSPFTKLHAEARRLMSAHPEVLEVGLYGGFPYADIADLGAAVLVYTDDAPDLANRVAERLEQRFLELRDEFFREVPTMMEVLPRLARRLTDVGGPIVIADVADNPGSGGSGDTTGVLHALADYGSLVGPTSLGRVFCGILYDPESTAAAWRVGIGNDANFAIGGKVNPAFGAPFQARMEVVALSPGTYRCVGPMLNGKELNLGRSALLRLGNLDLAISEGRSSVNDPAMISMFGRSIDDYDLLALKAKGHFRAAFEPLVRSIESVEAPGAAMTDFTALPFTKVSRDHYPFRR